MPSKLEQLRKMTDVVADTGDINAIEKYRPLDATTNPSLLLQAAQLPVYAGHVSAVVERAAGRRASDADALAYAADTLAVSIGVEILGLIPGRVSTEVDARLSFDTNAMVERAKRLIDLYEQAEINRNRILIKLASTWEGIEAARRLERDNINCNLTLLFGFAQAMACADAGAHLISPFVGRIADWHKARGELPATPAGDFGVQSVRRIYHYYKKHDFPTVVMGASFRNTGQIEELAGCDRLTISPDLLEQLASDDNDLPRKLDPLQTEQAADRETLDEAAFRWRTNEDAMATEKLAEGIRKFTADQLKLETLFKTWDARKTA